MTRTNIPEWHERDRDTDSVWFRSAKHGSLFSRTLIRVQQPGPIEHTPGRLSPLEHTPAPLGTIPLGTGTPGTSLPRCASAA